MTDPRQYIPDLADRYPCPPEYEEERYEYDTDDDETDEKLMEKHSQQ